MKRSKNSLSHTCLSLAALLCLTCAAPASATLITSTIGEFDGPTLINPTYPQPSLTIGTFTYTIPAGAVITSATVSGYFGTLFSPDTALENLFVAGIPVASCTSESAACWLAANQTPWSYTFTPSQYAALQSGSVNYTVVQTGDYYVESGITTLSITIAPEPSTTLLFCGSLALLPLLRRKRLA